MLDWTAAVGLLHSLCKEQVATFLTGLDKDDVYGFGFFCDASDGDVYLVANTEQYHLISLRDFEARFGQTDAEIFRWDIGNWKYPGGLFPSSSAEQQAFDIAWQEYVVPLSDLENNKKQAMLEDVCAKALIRLYRDGAFASVPSLKGFTVLGPDDDREGVLEKKKHLDILSSPEHSS